MSNITTGILGNHHAPAAGQVNGTGMVFAPISGSGDTPQCRLVAMTADTGTARWRYQVPPANCTIHSVADPTFADFDGDGTEEIVATTTEDLVAAFDPQTGNQEFEYNLTDYGYTQLVVANLTDDSSKEVVVVDVQGTAFVIRPNETAIWTRIFASQTEAQPAVGDFDGDGNKEMAVGTGQRLVLPKRNSPWKSGGGNSPTVSEIASSKRYLN